MTREEIVAKASKAGVILSEGQINGALDYLDRYPDAEIDIRVVGRSRAAKGEDGLYAVQDVWVGHEEDTQRNT